ncbi:MAG TPA: MBL fold metallo-hydrolase [Gammaproteobacteria bacterium]
MLRFASLASGSRGNALLVESGPTLLMIDCGLPYRDVEQRLAAVGRAPADVTAVLVTHEHGDHVRGVATFARRHGTPVLASHGTGRALAALAGDDAEIELEWFSAHRGLSIGGIDIEPFPVPHDAREPCQFVFAARGRRLGLLTDTGHVTPHIRERLAGCDALAIEFNHEAESLARGTYPPAVKARVASAYGHLSNAQAAACVEALLHGGLQWIAAMHVSERNNSREDVERALGGVLDGRAVRFSIAEQDSVSGWIDVE